MPYFTFHRGKQNTSSIDRVMFQIMTLAVDLHINSQDYVPDSELDETDEINQKTLENRQQRMMNN